VIRDYSSLRNAAARSDRRLKVGKDVELRAEMAAEKRTERARRAYERRVRQEEEDRNRYIIPEFQDLEEQLTG